MRGVIGVKHQLHAACLVGAVQFGITAIDTNERAATHALYVKQGEVISRRVMREVARKPHGVSPQESLVVSIDDQSLIADNIETVMGFVGRRQPMCGSEDDPELKRSREFHDISDGRGELSPVNVSVALEIAPSIAR